MRGPSDPDRRADEDGSAIPEHALGGAAGAFILGGANMELTPLRVEKRRLAAAVRRAIHALVATEPSIGLVRSAVGEVEALAELFEAQPRAGYEGSSEASTAPSLGGFFDRSPVLGQANPIAPPLELEVDGAMVRARAIFGSAYEGAPGCVHGGWVAAAFDEVLGAAQALGGEGGMTAYLKVDYRKPTPLHEALRFEGELLRSEGRKIFTVGRLYHGELLTAEAEGLFITIDLARFTALLEKRERREA